MDVYCIVGFPAVDGLDFIVAFVSACFGGSFDVDCGGGNCRIGYFEWIVDDVNVYGRLAHLSNAVG